MWGGALHRNIWAAVFVAAVALLAVIALTGNRGISAHHSCGATGSPAGAFDIQTYEAADYRNLYARTLELAGTNWLFPERAAFNLPPFERGGRAAGSNELVSGYIPPILLKAIAYVESGWAQASYDPVVDYGEIGPVLSSHDCGYGIMQVTTGMQNISGIPNSDQAMIGAHYAFNIARGARILGDKWNLAPEFRPIVGDRDPGVIENWYYALWGYNGFAFSNHPLNPSYQPTRAPFSCAPNGDGFGHDRSQYPYQEVILGCAQRPPVRGGAQLWAPQEVHLPNLSDPAFAGPMNVNNWNPCAYSLDCTAMDMPTPNTNHRDPTSIGLNREQVIGRPSMVVANPTVSITVHAPATLGSAQVSVANAGTGVLAYRVTSNAPWLSVSPDAGVALGSDLGSVPGTITVTADLNAAPPGAPATAQLRIESLYADGSPQTVTATVEGREAFAGKRMFGDFNGDGAEDFVQLCCGDTASIWLSNRDGTFVRSEFRPWAGYGLNNGEWLDGDFNGDGKDDLLHACCPDLVRLWRSTGNGTFELLAFSAWAGYPYQSGNGWQSGDFNGDGRADVIHFCCGDQVQTWFANGDGTFAINSFQPWPGYGTGGRWIAGDFNGDSRTDLAHQCCDDYMHIWRSRGDGRYDVAFTQAWPGYGMRPGSWITGDFNGDSREDLLHICCADYGHTWYGRLDGGFDVAIFQPWPGYGMRSGKWRTGDWNNDGKTDLIHLCCADYGHTWYGVPGGFSIGFFRPWEAYGLQSGAWNAADIDGDRRTDLVHFCCTTYAHGWRSLPSGFAASVIGP
jgi:hypothetical protein